MAEPIWILQVAQAAVLSEAAQLDVRLSSRGAELRWNPPWPPSPAQVRAAWEGRAESEALAALARGLRSVQGSWKLVFPGEPVALTGDGNGGELTHEALPGPGPLGEVGLGVSHSGSERQLREALLRGAYPFPIPLFCDDVRVDHLQGSPEHGITDHGYPVALGWATVEGAPRLTIPPGTFDAQTRAYSYDRLGDALLAEPVRAGAESATAACLVCAQVTRMDKVSQRPLYPTRAQESQVIWVQQGVVVGREALGWPASAISCGVFVSAEGLPRDEGGWLPRLGDKAAESRKLDACRALGAVIEHAHLSLHDIESVSANIDKGASVFVAGVAVVSSVLLGSPALLLVGGLAAGLGWVGAGSSEHSADEVLQKGLVDLQREWKARFSSTA